MMTKPSEKEYDELRTTIKLRRSAAEHIAGLILNEITDKIATVRDCFSYRGEKRPPYDKAMEMIRAIQAELKLLMEFIEERNG